MRKQFFLVASFMCLSELLLGLPQDHSVVSGDVKVHQPNPHSMVIEASNKSIIQHKKFNIKEGEKVKFVQPSSSSYVLNRVDGGKPSKILGKLESNGKVFLVNPKGIYFGPNAVVRAGSLVASTLDISNDDFLTERFRFVLDHKNGLSEIRNEGLLSASPEGSIVLMAPVIRNLGTIQAQAGKVVLAAGESVTLDFHGDKLLQFSVEGAIKGAVLEHLGSIQAENGEVSMQLPVAKKAIHEIVNRDGLERGEVFIEENGEILLVSASSIQAKRVALEAGTVQVEGKIDAHSDSDVGGQVSIAGTNLFLKGAQIDVSGKLGGGEVLVGGEFQGKGSMPYASKVVMDESSVILANATEVGDGGNVVLWSKDHTSFEGKILAEGGVAGGNGGIVESSSQDELRVFKGSVSTLAPQGEMGQWLLDPSELFIIAGFAPYSGCGGGFVGVSSFSSSSSGVVLCATKINQEVPILMSFPKSGISFVAPPSEIGLLYLKYDIMTTGGPVLVQNLNTILKDNILIDTTNVGAFREGANITFDSIDSHGGAFTLGLKGGSSGVVTVGDIGGVSRVGHLTMSGSKVFVKNIYTEDSPVTVASTPLLLTSPAVIDTDAGGGGGGIVLYSIDASSAGEQSLLIRAGKAGDVVIGNVGVNIPLSAFFLETGSDRAIVGDVRTYGGSIEIYPALQMNRSLSFKTYTDLNSYVSGGLLLGDVYATIPGSQSLLINTGYAGNIVIGNIGTSVIPLNNIVIDSSLDVVLGDVHASSLAVLGGGGNAFLRGDIELSGINGISIKEGSIYLVEANIEAKKLIFDVQSSILNKGGDSSITIKDTGSVYMNTGRVNGKIGTALDPVILNAEGLIQVGGTSVNLGGVHGPVEYLRDNKPCQILSPITGELLTCKTGVRKIYFQLPHGKLGRTLSRGNNPMLIGIYPENPETYNGIQNSSFGPLELALDHLDSPPPLKRKGPKV